MNREDVLRQLDRVTEDYRARTVERTSIRKWAVTFWGASIAGVASGKLPLHGISLILFIIGPLILFWSLELIASSCMFRREKLLCELERRLANEDYETDDPTSIYMFIIDNRETLRSKFNNLFIVSIKKARMNYMYTVLIILSLIYLFVTQKI